MQQGKPVTIHLSRGLNDCLSDLTVDFGITRGEVLARALAFLHQVRAMERSGKHVGVAKSKKHLDILIDTSR